MKKVCLFIMMLGVLAGCSAWQKEINYKQKLGEWLGKNATDLYSVWGTPQEVKAIDANAYIATFYQQGSTPEDLSYMPYSGIVNAEAINEPQFGTLAQPLPYDCQTSFEIRNNIVVDYNFSGDNCY